MDGVPASASAPPAAGAGDTSLGLWVRMKGLPSRVTTADIEAFFAGLRLASHSPILFKRHADGRTTGAAYVRFASTDEAQRAVALDCAIFSERFGQRYVHVYALAAGDATDLQATALASAEFEASLQAAAADGGTEAAAVLVRNLPAEAGQSHLAAFFSSFRVHPNGLQLGYHGPTARTGQAFVEFESPEEATRAVATLDRQPLLPEASKRFVRLEQVTLAEMREVLALRFGGEGIIRVRGIPASEVRTLFAGLAIKPGGVRLGVGPEAAAASGSALPVIAASCTFVEFATPADALKALEVRLPTAGGDAAERGMSVRLATRTELRRAHTVPEVQPKLAAIPEAPPLLVAAPFAATAAGALLPPRSQATPFSREAAALLARHPRVASPGNLLRATGVSGGPPPAGSSAAIPSSALPAAPGPGGMLSPAAAAAAIRRAALGGGAEPVAPGADAALAEAAGLPPGWRAVPHPGSQAVLCVNDATGEHMWLAADARLGSSPVAGMPAGASAASWHALASLHKAGSGGGTQKDDGVKAASAPAVLRPSPRYARPVPGAPPLPLQHVLSNASDGAAGLPLKALPSPRSTLGFSALSTLSSPRSSIGGSGSLASPRNSSRAGSGEGFRDVAALPSGRMKQPEGRASDLRSRSADVVGSAMTAFRPVGPAAMVAGGGSSELRAASTSAMFNSGFLQLNRGGGGAQISSEGNAADAAGHQQKHSAVAGDLPDTGNMSPPAKRSKAD